MACFSEILVCYYLKFMARFGMQTARKCHTEKGLVCTFGRCYLTGCPLALASPLSLLHSRVPVNDLCLSIFNDLFSNKCLRYLTRLARCQCSTIFTSVSVLQNDHIGIFKVKKQKTKNIKSSCHLEEYFWESLKDSLYVLALVTLFHHLYSKDIMEVGLDLGILKHTTLEDSPCVVRVTTAFHACQLILCL